ncbi:MAG: ATP phosphoribosyltransferase regulatory subunit [Hespellia sp.]|jgi:ATP phosphoribosyltransferase regulatory subunit|nr:ATP phosphoribosyltransferase regulatory subunit [Hespellia sp.]
MKQLLHTPEGVRDIYNKECGKKMTVQNKLHQIFHLYGYHDIQTPTFEFFDVFRKEIGTISSRELYKFFDREGNTLVLRPDITPSIARAAATLFEDEKMPIRLCYIGNTFINHSSYQGRMKENTQMGAELLGLDSIEADVEMLAMVINGLKSVGLEKFQVSIGHVDFIQNLLEETGFVDEQLEQLIELINNRNYFGVDEVMDASAVKGSVKEAFHILPELTGSVEILENALKIAPSINARLAITHLQKMYEMLKLYGVEKYITFDLSMQGSYGYYTGIIFRAYTYGTGDAIVRGGRYDHLVEKFGKNTPSIGFAILLDELMNALNRQRIAVDDGHFTLIVYTDSTLKWALSLAEDFRKKGKCTELLKRKASDDIKKYVDYGKRRQVVSMLWLQEDHKIRMKNLVTEAEKIIQF